MTAPPIHFGMLGPFTGFNSNLGTAITQGSEVAQLAINEAGGILGRELALDSSDTKGDAPDAVGALSKLIDDDHAVAIIGPESSEYFAVRPTFTQFQIPCMMQGGTVLLDHETDPYFWRDSPSDSVLTVAMAVYARKVGYTRAALMMLAENSPQPIKVPLTKTFENLGGEIVADVTILPGQTSYRSEVRELINAHPEVIFTETDPVSAAVIFANFRELNNLAIPFIGTDLTAEDEYLQAITYQVARDRLTSVSGAPITDRGAFQQYYHRLFPDQEPPANAAYAYDAVISVALAIDRAGSTDGPKINAAMMTVTNPPGRQCYDYANCAKLLRAGVKINYEGASGNLDYNQYHNVFGTFGALRVDLTGRLQWVAIMTESELRAAAP